MTVRPPAKVGQALTHREIQVLLLVCESLDDGQIGKRLFLEASTVKTHVSRLRAKLGAKNRAHAVAIGFRKGLIR